MPETLHTVLLAAILFAATNADDLVLLSLFYSRPGCTPLAVTLGQLTGIGSLIAISYTAARLSLAVPHGWLPWIGVVPLVIGLRWLLRTKEREAPPLVTRWWAVAGVTLANGGDNLGVYIPAFAIQTDLEKVITGLIFLLLTLVWCGLAWSATRHPTLGPRISHACNKAGPFVLILIGLWIIAHHPLFGLNLGPEIAP